MKTQLDKILYFKTKKISPQNFLSKINEKKWLDVNIFYKWQILRENIDYQADCDESYYEWELALKNNNEVATIKNYDKSLIGINFWQKEKWYINYPFHYSNVLPDKKLQFFCYLENPVKDLGIYSDFEIMLNNTLVLGEEWEKLKTEDHTTKEIKVNIVKAREQIKKSFSDKAAKHLYSRKFSSYGDHTKKYLILSIDLSLVDNSKKYQVLLDSIIEKEIQKFKNREGINKLNPRMSLVDFDFNLLVWKYYNENKNFKGIRKYLRESAHPNKAEIDSSSLKKIKDTMENYILNSKDLFLNISKL